MIRANSAIRVCRWWVVEQTQGCSPLRPASGRGRTRCRCTSTSRPGGGVVVRGISGTAPASTPAPPGPASGRAPRPGPRQPPRVVVRRTRWQTPDPRLEAQVTFATGAAARVRGRVVTPSVPARRAAVSMSPTEPSWSTDPSSSLLRSPGRPAPAAGCTDEGAGIVVRARGAAVTPCTETGWACGGRGPSHRDWTRSRPGNEWSSGMSSPLGMDRWTRRPRPRPSVVRGRLENDWRILRKD